MAIQTRGFDVNVMPKPGLADPSLVAFNPARIGQGMQEGLALSEQLAKLKAFKLEQEEKAMLASDRINAIKAQYKGIADQTPQQTRQITAGADLAVGTTPGAISATNATNARTTMVAPVLAQNDVMAAFAARPGIFSGAKVKSLQDEVAAGNAEIDISTQPSRKKTAGATAESAQVAAEGAAATAAQDADTKTIMSNLANAAANDDADNFWSNRDALKKQRDLQTKTMEAQLANINAMVENNLSEASMRRAAADNSKTTPQKIAATRAAANDSEKAWRDLMTAKIFDENNQESNLMTYMYNLEAGKTDRIPAYDSLIKQAEDLKAESQMWKEELKRLVTPPKEGPPMITVPGMSGKAAAPAEGEDAVTYSTPKELDQALMAGDITIAEHKRLDERLFGKKK